MIGLTSARHHPMADVLVGYAAGALSEPMALIVATHLALCPECRHAVAQAEALGGALFESVAGEPQDATVLSSAVDAAIERAAHQAAPVPREAAASALPARRLFPQPLAGYVGGDLDQVSWKRLGPGIRHAIVARNPDGATARLLRIEPGRAVFEHSHTGTELTLVLQGSYSAGGQRFARGDLEQADESVLHRPVAGDEAVCICLAVTDAPLKFQSPVGRLLQPFFGI